MDDAQKPTPCVRATASRYIAWRARWLAAHERREDLAQHAPHVGGDLGVGLGEGRRRLRCFAGAAATWVATLTAAGGAMVPVVSTGTREIARARTSRRSRYPKVAPRRIDPASSAEWVRRSRRFASTTEATKLRCLVSLEEPGAHLWPPFAGCFLTGRLKEDDPHRLTAVKDGEHLSDRLGDGPCCTCPASCDARAVVGLPRALLLPTRLDGAHEAIWANFVLFRSEDLGLA